MLLAELFPYAHVVWIVFTVLYALTILGTIVVVISENRNPVKSLAWVTVLILLPVLGALLYLFFGRSLRGQRLISRTSSIHLRQLEDVPSIDDRQLPLTAESKQMIRMVNSIAEPHYFGGCHIDIYTEGAQKFAALKRDLLAAEHYINIQYFIFLADKIGQELSDILIAKAQQGVKVRVIYDHVGSMAVAKSFFVRMRRAGVEAYPFLKVTLTTLANRLNWRNHRKLVIIDGRIGYIGGMNVADRYVYGSRGQRPWRDTHLRVTGNAVKAMQFQFAVDWCFMRRGLLEQPTVTVDSKPGEADGIQLVGSGPTDLWNGMAMVFQRAIGLAKHSIYIQTPYFLPNEGLVRALQQAALSGVDVRLMIPEDPDSKTLRYSSFSYVKEMLLAGIKVYFYQGRMLHSKMVLVDEELVTVGSTNFDYRSFEHNFEWNALIYSRDFNARMRHVFIDDMRSCQRITLPHWTRRPLGQRMLESLARLLSPLL